jgi:hypothetical protein
MTILNVFYFLNLKKKQLKSALKIANNSSSSSSKQHHDEFNNTNTNNEIQSSTLLHSSLSPLVYDDNNNHENVITPTPTTTNNNNTSTRSFFNKKSPTTNNNNRLMQFSNSNCNFTSIIPVTPSCLLGNFEESLLNGRMQPVGFVDGFYADLGASGSFFPPHESLPVNASFYQVCGEDVAASPYLVCFSF